MSFKPSGGSGGSISGSSDTALSNPADGQVLTYNASLQKWQNNVGPAQQQAGSGQYGGIKLAGDIGGTPDAPAVTKIRGVAISATAPTAGQVLTATGATAAGWATPSGGGSSASDATASAKGVVQLTGDLGGSAGSPTVPGLVNKAAKGANSDITSLSGLTTALSVAQGGTGATTATSALGALGGLASSQRAAANGVASLDGSSLVPKAQLGSGTASASTVLYGDGVWRAPSGGSGGTSAYAWTATKTANYTAASGDAVIADASAGGFTVTLPSNLGANAYVRVKKIDSTVNAVLVYSTASIDGSASFSLNNQYMSQDFSYSGTTWYAV